MVFSYSWNSNNLNLFFIKEDWSASSSSSLYFICISFFNPTLSTLMYLLLPSLASYSCTWICWETVAIVNASSEMHVYVCGWCLVFLHITNADLFFFSSISAQMIVWNAFMWPSCQEGYDHLVNGYSCCLPCMGFPSQVV